VLAAGAYGALTLVLIAAALAEIPLRSAYIAAGRGEIATAESDFNSAHQLRPWDPALDAAAGHAFAELTSGGIPGAGAAGGDWISRALKATPDSIQVIGDAATIDIARRQPRAAARLLRHALSLDPLDGDLRLAAGAVALLLHHRAAAIALAVQARRDYPPDAPRAGQLISDADRK
jgi:tetratricopeptide (TPR) repeat protein